MTALLTTLAAPCIILSRAAQIDRVRIYQSPESTEVQRQEAMTELVGANVRLAHKVAKQHVRKGLEFNDLLAQACEGIVYAATKYDCTSKASFTTYAKQWMRAKCQEHVQANANSLKAFASSLNDRQRAILAGRIMHDLLGREQRCAKTFGVSKQRVGQIEKQLRTKLVTHFTRAFGEDGVDAMLRSSF